MGSLHVPRLAWPRRAMLRRGRRGCAALAVAVLAALTLVNGAQHPAYGATGGPYGGTAAAVPGTVQAANYDTGGQGVAYNVTSANGSANSYRSDGVDLEATADTQDTTRRGAYDIGWTDGRAVVQLHRQRRHGRAPTRSPSGCPRRTGSPTRCTSPTPPAPT